MTSEDIKIGYDNLVTLGAQAMRLSAIGQAQANILNWLRDPQCRFTFADTNFAGDDAKRLLVVFARELENLSQEGRKVLEAAGVSFPVPPADKANGTSQ